MKCKPKECNFCQLSQWSSWSECTRQCGGHSKRYRSYYGEGCKRYETEEEVKKCEKCYCTLNGKDYLVRFNFENSFFKDIQS